MSIPNKPIELLDKIVELVEPFAPSVVLATKGCRLNADDYLGMDAPKGYKLQKISEAKATKSSFNMKGLMEALGSEKLNKKYYEAALYLARAIRSATDAQTRSKVQHTTELVVDKFVSKAKK